MREARRGRKLGGPGWNVWRAIVGLAYLVAALFNAVYTLPRADEAGLLDGYAEGAWFQLLEDFMRDVFAPSAALFLVLVIVFEVVVGILILARDVWVDVGVVASLLWVLAILPFLAWPYLLTNIALAVVQGSLLLRRYDTEIWTLLVRAFGSRAAPHPGWREGG